MTGAKYHELDCLCSACECAWSGAVVTADLAKRTACYLQCQAGIHTYSLPCYLQEALERQELEMQSKNACHTQGARQATRTHIDSSSLSGITGSVWSADIAGRSRLINDVPSKDGRLILVSAVGDGVEAVSHGSLVVLVQLDDVGVDVELFWVLSTSPDDIAVQAISCSPVVSQSQDELHTCLVCFSNDLIQSFERCLIVLTCRQVAT